MLEDDTTLGRGIQLALQDPDVTIALTGTLSQAREMLAQKKFDLLILDVNLPDGSALDLLREVRQGEAVPVILLTANDLEMDVVTGLESGQSNPDFHPAYTSGGCPPLHPCPPQIHKIDPSYHYFLPPVGPAANHCSSDGHKSTDPAWSYM